MSAYKPLIMDSMYKTVFDALEHYPVGSMERASVLKSLRSYDLVEAVGLIHDERMYMLSISDDNIYRVTILGDAVTVLCFGLESVDSQLEGHYDCIDALPDWVKERLAVLTVISCEPPMGEIPTVGRRISEKVFWVYAPTSTSEASASA